MIAAICWHSKKIQTSAASTDLRFHLLVLFFSLLLFLSALMGGNRLWMNFFYLKQHTEHFTAPLNRVKAVDVCLFTSCKHQMETNCFSSSEDDMFLITEWWRVRCVKCRKHLVCSVLTLFSLICAKGETLLTFEVNILQLNVQAHKDGEFTYFAVWKDILTQ